MNKLFSFLIVVGLFVNPLVANYIEAPLLNKSTFKIGYDMSFSPRVSRVIGPDEKSSLSQLHRGALEVFYPFYRYLQLGIDLDYTFVKSPKQKDLRLSLLKDPAKIMTQFLGLGIHVRPQLPLRLAGLDMIAYVDAALGIGTTSPISFGTQPLANYTYDETKTMPTPFPLFFETTPKVGLQLFAWRFIGIEAGGGFRMLWVAHPMVNIPKGKGPLNPKTTNKKIVWYDVSAPFVHASINFAF